MPQCLKILNITVLHINQSRPVYNNTAVAEYLYWITIITSIVNKLYTPHTIEVDNYKVSTATELPCAVVVKQEVGAALSVTKKWVDAIRFAWLFLNLNIF